jgi:precorrin-2 dehydrogenase/sirohydrochlorin ferrochelatase
VADYYPIMLSLKGKKCVVIGGGAVAERKVAGLMDGGANDIVVVAPKATDALERLNEDGSIRLLRREYKKEDAEGAFLLFAATDDRDVNCAAAAAGQQAGALVNVADEAGEGGFVTPAAVRRGELLIAVTTGGASPALTAIIAREIGKQYGNCYADRIARLRLLRERLTAEIPDRAKRQAVLRLAAVETAECRAEEPIDANDAHDAETETIEEWMRRLMLAADGRQM